MAISVPNDRPARALPPGHSDDGMRDFSRRIDVARRDGLSAAVVVAADGVHPAEMAVRIDGAAGAALLDTIVAACQPRALRIEFPDVDPAANYPLLECLAALNVVEPPAVSVPVSMVTDRPSRDWLGAYRGAQCVRLSPPFTRAQQRSWRELPRLTPVLHSRTLSGCHALGAESAATYLPCCALAMPAAAAPVVVTLDILDRDCSEATLRADLDEAVARAVSLAEACHDRLRWPFALQALDAFMNRRVAIVPTGLGDWALAVEPRHERRALELRRLLARILRSARRRSQLLANECGMFPAMEAEHALSSRDAGRRDEWRRRWTQVTAGQRYRHRHVVFVQLADCWPRDDDSARHAELLPALVGIDGVGFGGRWSELVRRHSADKLLTRAFAALRY